MNTQRNTTLELMKLLASYAVVFIHVLFYGRFGIIVDAIARFAVPFFFLVSGFFSYRIAPEKILKRAKHILYLFIFGMVCYNIMKMLQHVLVSDMDGILVFLHDYIDIKALLIMMLFNKPAHGIYLWYLLATIYVYVVFYFATVHHANERTVFSVCVGLLCLQLLLGEFGFIFPERPPVFLVRNFLFMGIPFFGFGLMAKKYEQTLRHIPNALLIISAAFGILATILSRLLLGESQLYVGSLFILFPLVIIFIKYPHIKQPRIFSELAGCSTYIYIFHVMVAYVLEVLYKFLGFDRGSSIELQMLHPIFVCIISTIVAYIICKIINTIFRNAGNR